MRTIQPNKAILVYHCDTCKLTAEQSADSVVKSGTAFCSDCEQHMMLDGLKIDEPPAITATLTAINSKRDQYGNCYWALKFCDHATGKVVVGKVSGGESNIYSIRRIWNPDIDGWDRSIQFRTEELPIREFNRLTKDWKYAGSGPDELVTFIRTTLETQEG